jgi:serine/threonine protein kinase
MGAVYEAQDCRLGTTVALKQTLFSDEELSRAFEREARLLASLSHPALPRVSDHFVEGGGQFLVMEFIPGDDLAGQLKLRERPFECDQVLDWAYQLLDALEYLHSHRPPVIHRDIKPQNLKTTDAGRIILLDFGLAKGEPQLLDRGTASSVFGYTLNYAPLEQIEHKGTDRRSDLYSLGATLYQLMTGLVPPGSLSRAAAIVSGEGDPLLAANLVNPRVSIATARVITHAMALRADQRYSSAAAVRQAFGEASWRPSSGHPIFGKVAAGDAWTTPGFDPAGMGSQTVTERCEAPTHPAMIPQPDFAVATVLVPPGLTARLSDGDTTFRSRWIWFLASILTIFLFLTVFWSARLGESDPLPAPKFGEMKPQAPNPPPPGLQAPADPPASESPGPIIPPPEPSIVLPRDPPIVIPSTDAIKLEGVVWNRNGTVTLYWLPVPEAVKYRLEIEKQGSSKALFLGETEHAFYTLSSDESGPVRIIAILRGGREVVSRWFQIPRDQTPNK